jgi:hypothetical protein
MKLLISGNRDSTYHVDLVLAQKEAKDLYEAGQGMLGTDENYFIRILCSRSYCQLRATFNYYLHIVENPIEKGIKNEMSGNLSIRFSFLFYFQLVKIRKFFIIIFYRISLFSNYKIDK